MVAVNESAEELSIRYLRITQIAGKRRVQRTMAASGMGPMLVQGTTQLGASGAVVFDIQEPSGADAACERLLLEMGLLTKSGFHATQQAAVSLVRHRTRYIGFPLDGQWFTANARSELHCLGTQFGFDFIHPEDAKLHELPPTHAVAMEKFASFGQVLRAPVDGIVAAVEAGQPDLPPLLSRLTFPDGPPKDAPRSILLGNYVLIRLDSGAFLLLAHLRRWSIRVTVGQRIEAGMQIAEVGNSGNTSGPHLHIEMLDAAPDLAAIGTLGFVQSGVPFGFYSLKVYSGAHKTRRPGKVVPSRGDVVGTWRKSESEGDVMRRRE